MSFLSKRMKLPQAMLFIPKRIKLLEAMSFISKRIGLLDARLQAQSNRSPYISTVISRMLPQQMTCGNIPGEHGENGVQRAI